MGIRLEHVSVDIKNARILDDVNLEVRKGEFVSLLGASGAGKSTTVKVIAGILEQTAGHVYIDGANVDGLAAHKRRASIVFQDVRLFPHMSVGENVAYALRIQGVRKRERMERAEYYLKLVKLEGFAHRRVDELSGGQQQRVALARSVAGSPAALLLDEPFSGLDEGLRDDMRSTVLDLHEQLGMTCVMITHDADEALMMSDRVAYMSGGKIIQYGLPQDLYASPQSFEVAACFGDCITLEGLVHQGVFSVPGFFHFEAHCQDGEAVAILRRKGVLVEQRDGGAPVVECSFRGDSFYVIVNVDGTQHGLFSSRPFEIGERVALRCEERFAFVFSKNM